MNTAIQTTENSLPAEAREQRYLKPSYDVSFDDHTYTVEVILPGVAKEGVEVAIEEDFLTITGHRQPILNPAWKALHQEIPQADYRLKLQLNVFINADQIKAVTENGILTVTLPVAEEAKPRQIAVE